MARIEIVVNGARHATEAAGDMPLLWFLRDELGLTGTKYGCGEGVCGSCTVLEGERAVRACQVTVAEASGRTWRSWQPPHPAG